MEIIKREVVFEGKYLRFVKKDARTITDDKISWETVERTNIDGKGVVVIIGLTSEKELILEKNWRAPVESSIIQFPAGLIDIAGESQEEAARRELLEETGYKAKKLIPVISAPNSPELTSTRAVHFFAPEVEFTGEGKRDSTEEIEVLKVPVEKIDDFLLNLPVDAQLDLRVPGILWILERKKLI